MFAVAKELALRHEPELPALHVHRAAAPVPLVCRVAVAAVAVLKRLEASVIELVCTGVQRVKLAHAQSLALIGVFAVCANEVLEHDVDVVFEHFPALSEE